MQYQIALSPDLGISPDDFAAAWNESAEAHNAATINLTRAKGASYLDPVTTAIIISTVSTIGLGVVTNAIYDVLKAALIKKGKPETTHKHTKITQLELPDGTRLITVDEEEG